MDPIIQINKNSDFDFEYRLNDSWSGCPFRLTFYTIDKEDNFYTVYFDGTEYSSCTPTDHNSVIAHLDHPELYCGCLRIEVEYFVDSASFYDGIYNDIRVEKTNVYIVREQSDVTSVIYEGSPSINFDPTNLTNNVEQALNDISDKNDALESALDALEDAQETVDGLIEELSEWKETTDNLVDQDTLNDYAKLTDLGPYMTEDEVSDWLNNYYTKTDCNTRYYTKTQIDVMLNEINPTVDLSNYATKAELAEVASGGNINLTDYVTKNELSNAGYLTQHQSLNDYATKNWVYNQNYITLDYLDGEGIYHIDLDGYVKYEDLNLDDYATKTWIGNQGFLTQHQSLEGLASQSWVQNQHYLTQHQSLSNYVTTSALNNRLSSYATTQYVESRIQEIGGLDLNDYASKTWIQNQGFLTQHQDLSQYATKSYVESKISEIDVSDIDLSSYVSKAELQSQLNEAGYLTSHQSLTDYATKSYVANAIANAEIGGEIDLTDYVSKTELSNCGYLTQSQIDQAGYMTSVPADYTSYTGLYAYLASIGITKNNDWPRSCMVDSSILFDCELRSATESENITPTRNDEWYLGGPTNQWLCTYTKKLYIDGIDADEKYLTSHQSLANYVTKNQLSSCGYLISIPNTYPTYADISNMGYATQSYVADYVNTYAPTPDMSAYATKAELASYATKAELGSYVSKTELDGCGYLTSQNLSNYATIGYVTGKISQIQTVTYNMTPTIWQGTLTQYNDLPDHTSYQLYLIAQQ